MKQLLRTPQHSHHNSKGNCQICAWASLDCLLTSLPIIPLSRLSTIMRSNGNLSMTDTRRISPQTTSSSGYHSDLSSATSANESPQSIHEILPIRFDKSPSSSSSHLQKKNFSVTTNSTYDKSLNTKNLSRISSFIRKQYERAKSKLTSKSLSSSYAPTTSTTTTTATVTTCSKATSTTPISHLSEDNYTLTNKQTSLCNQKSHYVSSVYKQNSYTEPVYSVYVHPLHNNQKKIITPPQHKNYASIHECYSQQPSYRYSAINNTQQYSSSSYRRLATMANFQNNTNNYNLRRHHYYPVEVPSSCQNYYPYRYTNKNYDYTRSNYVSLSDVISTKTSAFKPVSQKQKAKQFYQRPTYNIYEQISPSNDPCDLEVAQYFPQTSQWSNPNYFDIYSKELNAQKQNYTETLC